MVDRITPVTTDETRRYVSRTYHVDDAWPVVCEDFTAWVLEDRFTLGRPPYQDAGVALVPDVAPYELMKLRLLNAGHPGHRLLRLPAGLPVRSRGDRRPGHREPGPPLHEGRGGADAGPCPASTSATTSAACWPRFSNPYVPDTLLRLGTDGSDRIAQFLLPVVRDRQDRGLTSPWSAAIVGQLGRLRAGPRRRRRPDRLHRTAARPRRRGGQAAAGRPGRLPDRDEDLRRPRRGRRVRAPVHRRLPRHHRARRRLRARKPVKTTMHHEKKGTVMRSRAPQPRRGSSGPYQSPRSPPPPWP